MLYLSNELYAMILPGKIYDVIYNYDVMQSTEESTFCIIRLLAMLIWMDVFYVRCQKTLAIYFMQQLQIVWTVDTLQEFSPIYYELVVWNLFILIK